ncbi:hypothetical protein SLE2022_099320 [Rubroshorea leprosula]
MGKGDKRKYYRGRQEVDITAVEDWKVLRVWGDVIRIRGIFVQLREMLAKGFRWGVGDGRRIGFWRDIWVGNKSLSELCPRLFSLSANKESVVGKMGFWEGDKWCWRLEWRKGKMGRERDEEELLWEVLGRVRLKQQEEDCWKWAHDPKGRYVVKMAYEFLAPREGVLQGQLCKLVWCKLVPSKVAFFGWRLCLDRLPTKLNLEKRGVNLHGERLLCSLCSERVEEVDHLFCTCKEAWLVWAKVLHWWAIEAVLPNTVEGVAEFFSIVWVG